jgi:hypothetical protein
MKNNYSKIITKEQYDQLIYNPETNWSFEDLPDSLGFESAEYFQGMHPSGMVDYIRSLEIQIYNPRVYHLTVRILNFIMLIADNLCTSEFYDEISYYYMEYFKLYVNGSSYLNDETYNKINDTLTEHFNKALKIIEENGLI